MEIGKITIANHIYLRYFFLTLFLNKVKQICKLRLLLEFYNANAIANV